MVGFVLEGSGDSSILYDDDLADATPALGTDIGTPTYSSTGVIFGVDEGIALDLSSLIFPSSLEVAGSYSFFVYNRAPCIDSSTNGTAGTTDGTNRYFITHNADGTTSQPSGRLRTNVSDAVVPQMQNTDAQTAVNISTAARALTFPVFHYVTWNSSGTFDYYVDGRKVMTGIVGNSFASFLDFVWIGMDRGQTNTTNVVGEEFSRLCIADGYTTFTNLGVMMGLGDSFIMNGREKSVPGEALSNPFYDVTTFNEIQALYRINQSSEWTYINSGVGGEDTAAVLARTDTALSTNNPKIVVLHVGTNDANNIGGVSASQAADYESIVQKCVDFAGVEQVICQNIITTKGDSTKDSQQFIDQVAEVNGNIATAVAAVRSSKATIVDSFTAYGGESPSESPTIDSLIRGFQNTDVPNSDLHPSSQGMVVDANLIFTALNTPTESPTVRKLYRHSMPLTGRGMGGKHTSPLIKVRK